MAASAGVNSSENSLQLTSDIIKKRFSQECQGDDKDERESK
jgi:hypothetical protein